MSRYTFLWFALMMIFSVSLVQAQRYHTFDDKKKDAVAVKPSTFNPVNISGKHHSQARRSSSDRKYTPLAFHVSDSAGQKPEKIIYDKQSTIPIFMEGALDNEASSSAQARTSLLSASHAYLEQVKDKMRIINPGEEFVVDHIQTDALGQQHIRMQQHFQGIRVYNAEIILHTQATEGKSVNGRKSSSGTNAIPGQITRMNGRYHPTPKLQSVSPAISAVQAAEYALQDLKKHTQVTILSKQQQELLQYKEPATELVIYYPPKASEKPVLAWHLTVRPNFVERWEYFVDAKRGEVIDYYNHTCHIDGPVTAIGTDLSGTTRQLQTYESGGWQYLIDATRAMFNPDQSKMPDDPVGAIITLDAQNQPYNNMEVYYVRSQNNTWNDPASVSAHYNASMAYEYYLNTHNRNSINGQGGRIISIVNITDEDGSGLDNAFWNGAAMMYGNGNYAFSALAKSMDVAGHEMTHGVIGNSAKLEYRNESGAINESMADVFGILIEREQDDWQLGEDVVNRDYFPSGALRDMSDPHNGGYSMSDNGYQPSHVNEQYFGDEDNGGVHINSGIVNHAFYLFASNNSVGLEKAEKVYYQALTNYLTALSQFVDLRIAVIQAATDLYGAESNEVQAAKEAFSAVGIEDGESTEPRPDLPTANGQEYILSYDVNPEDENTLYLSNTEGSDYVPLSTTEIISKPSVTDDGSQAVFVSDDHNLRVISLQEGAEEQIIQDEGIWKAVAVSKDGNRVAAVTTEIDTSIYVYDFEAEQWAKFQLYNPSSAEGITTDEVLYADAIEWDYTGEYLMYDAFNRFEGADSVDIEFWDVGFIKVWDNETNTFGSGDIQKLFTSLPEGASIGNASFSKNSPSIVAFDYANFNEETYGVLAANLVTGEVEAVYSNTRLGFPNYSSTDDKIIFDAEDEEGNEVLAVIDMQEDKIKPVEGSAKILIPDARWGIWFTQGERQLLSSEKQMLSFSFEDLNPEIKGVITEDSIMIAVPEGTDLTALVSSFTHSELATVEVNEVEQVSGVTPQDFSNIVTYTVTAEDGSEKDYFVAVSTQPDKVLSSEKGMLTFMFEAFDPVVEGLISADSINLLVPEGTNLSNMVASFTASELASVRIRNVEQQSGVTPNDFSQAIDYNVIAEDGSFRTYVVIVTVDKTTGIDDDLNQVVKLYPNPVEDVLTISSTSPVDLPLEVVVYDMLGRKVCAHQWSSVDKASRVIPMVGFSPGMYVVKAKTTEKFITQRIIKK